MEVQTPDGGLSGSQAVYELIDDLVEQERARQQTLEERGVRVITASAAFATLLFAIAKFGVGENRHLGLREDGFLVGALVCFALAAGLGVLTNQLRGYSDPTTSFLKQLIKESNTNGSRLVGELWVGWLGDARRENDFKAIYLFLAISFQMLAVISVAASVTILLTDPSRLPWLPVIGGASFFAFLMVARRAVPTTWRYWRQAVSAS
ncbi:MAG: hypothetical protein E6J14_15220 [Chloroflexi bacterium]|nr:MAG: hypothetical protein E6J14_15220 [Chloroflexota bacterium]